MTPKFQLSVIVPALNEADNLPKLVERLDASLSAASIAYEIIIIDDHSQDGTVNVSHALADRYPVSVYLKKGDRGKAQSLLEGFSYAQADVVCMIDGDLQYPPEAIPEMMAKYEAGHDVVIANRVKEEGPLMRKIASRVFMYLFTNVLHGLHCDVQTGLKLFRKSILSELNLAPTPWTFDLEFLLKARNYGYTLGTVGVFFAKRNAGDSKINLIKSTWELGSNAVLLKFKKINPLHIHPSSDLMIGAGVIHKQKRFTTHTTLQHPSSALETFATWQKIALAVVISAAILGFYTNALVTGIVIMAILNLLYFADVLFNLYLVTRSLKHTPEISPSQEEISALNPDNLPVYSILCPLYKEAHVLPHFLSAIGKIDWPKNKLDVLLLLEENDPETIEAARALSLPEYVRIIVVPNSQPKTKPKACNYGLSVARGEYLVIYDAEDIPDPLQLKKAYCGFRMLPRDVTCLQAKLNYYNPHQNLLTRLFTAEYSLWFDVTLTGLQSINTYIPLGGTSNHFRTDDLRELEGWDPFNVTEDCDLGIRLFKHKLKTAIIDSITLEEANSDLKNWIRQRSRWIKGYMQTYLVHMRKPTEFVRSHGMHAFIFQLVVGGKIAFVLINPLLWATTILYFVLKATVGPTIEALFPAAIFYLAVFSCVFGNFLFLYYYMIGCAKRGHWSLMKYIYTVPLYWAATSFAAYMAIWQLFFKPHYWEKTHHGLHLGAKIPTVLKQKAQLGGGLRERFAALLGSEANAQIAGGAGILLASMMLSNLINLIFNAYVGRVLGFESLGLVVFINTLWALIAIGMHALSQTVNYTASSLAQQSKNASKSFFARVKTRSVITALFISIIWLFAAPELTTFFKLPDITPLLLFTPIFAYGTLMSVHRGYLHGNLNFKSEAAIFISESLSKFIGVLIIMSLGLEEYVYLAIPFSIIVAAITAAILNNESVAYKAPLRGEAVTPFPSRFYIAAIFTGISGALFLNFDMVLVKHYLSATDAGTYALLALVGKMVYFFGSLPNIFMVTFVARAHSLGTASIKTFRTIFGLSALCVMLGALLLTRPLGSQIVPFIFGEKAESIIPLLTTYVIAMGLFTLSNVIITYHLAKKHYLFPATSLALSLSMCVGILFNHGSIQDVARVIVVVSTAGFITLVFFHFIERHVKFIRSNILDFLSVFSHLPVTAPQIPAHKRILILNWRDIEHTFAGGAEVYVHEIAKKWAAEGHHVTLFAGNDGHNPRNDEIDGVHIVRRGGFYLVYFWAFVYYVLRFRGKFDIIVDCQNGIPFFTPLYTTKPIYCLMHHVHQEVFYHSLPLPLAAFASFLEKRLMPLLYRTIPIITVSDSSMNAIRTLGLGKSGITVVNPGVDLHSLKPGSKSAVPTILYLGRLKAYKSVDVLIKAFALVIKQSPLAHLIIAGSGEEDMALKDLVYDLGLKDSVTFAGKVSDEEKVHLLQKAWALVNPSLMEGWAITTIEANACGTPVIASNVPGLRDSVLHEEAGYLVEYGNSQAFADRVLMIINDDHLRAQMNNNAIQWAQKFSWTETSARVLSAISNIQPRKQSQYTYAKILTATIITASAASLLLMANYAEQKELKNHYAGFAPTASVTNQKFQIDNGSTNFNLFITKISGAPSEQISLPCEQNGTMNIVIEPATNAKGELLVKISPLNRHDQHAGGEFSDCNPSHPQQNQAL